MRKLLAFLLALTMLLSFAACSSDADKDEEDEDETEEASENFEESDDEDDRWGWIDDDEPSYEKPAENSYDNDNESSYEEPYSQEASEDSGDYDVHNCDIDEDKWEYNDSRHWNECDCGEKYNRESHEAGSWEIVKEASVGVEGYKKLYCEVCGYLMEEATIPALEETHVHAVSGSGWSYDKNNHYHTCECGEKLDKSSHTAGEWKVTKAAAAGVEGKKELRCKTCNYLMDEETIAALPTANTINVPSIKQNSHSISAITQVSGAGIAVEKTVYDDTITYENQVITYTYTVKHAGRTRIEISEMMNGNRISLNIYDSLGNNVGSFSPLSSNGQGVTLKNLNIGEVYTIKVKQSTGTPSYRLTVWESKNVVDISDYTLYSDSIEYTDQRNEYSFKVPTDGRYRFEIQNMMNGNRISLNIYDSLGSSVGSFSPVSSNSQGITLKDLKAGETYKVCVTQSTGTPTYDLLIGKQKSTLNISNYTEIKDSVEYTDQRNVYTFTPSIDGRYRFEIQNMKSGTRISLNIYDSLGSSVGSFSPVSSNGQGVTLKDLKAGETYKVCVTQSTGFASYTLKFWQQKKTTNITDNTIVNDSVEHTDQRNVYSFTAKTSGKYTFTISGMESGVVVQLYAFNELDETIKSNTYCTNGNSITIDVIAGETYEIQVRQSSKTGSYTLTVKP